MSAAKECHPHKGVCSPFARFLKNIGIKVTEIGGQMKDQNQNSNLVNR